MTRISQHSPWVIMCPHGPGYDSTTPGREANHGVLPVLRLHRKEAFRLPCHHLTRPLRAALVGAEVAGLGVHVAPAKLASVLVQLKDVDGTCPSCSSSQNAGQRRVRSRAVPRQAGSGRLKTKTCWL